MTTGSIIKPGPSYRTYSISYPLGGAESTTELGIKQIGANFKKTWTGGDLPPAKRTYTTLTYWLPAFTYVKLLNSRKGTFRVKRVRVGPKKHSVRMYDDKKRRSSKPDHAYSMNLDKTESGPFSSTSYSLDGSVFPAVRGRVHARTYGDTMSTYGDGFAISQRWGGNDDIALVSKLRTRIAGTSFNMGVFLGEGRKSLKLIEDSAITILTAYRAVRRGDLAGAAYSLGVTNRSVMQKKSNKTISANEVSARWLELQYGWAPLVQDAYEGAGYLATRLNSPFVQSYRVRHKINALITRSGNKWSSSSAEAYTSAQLIARIEEISEVQLVGLLDPASLVWELLPYSFVFDWFLPIGNYLQARSLNSALTGRYVTTKVVRSQTSYSGLSPTPSGSTLYPYSQDWSGISGRSVRIAMSRTLSTSLSVPYPSFKKLSDVPSWKRAANAVALITQAVIRR